MSIDVAVVGPIAPLRGGIAAHSARLVEALLREDSRVGVLSYSRLYPSIGFPGISQFHSVHAHEQESGGRGAAGQGAPQTWPGVRVDAVLDTLDPRSWRRGAALLAALAPARVVAQWWHPIAAPALIRVLGERPRSSVTLVCHNLLPHESFPLARRLARATLDVAGVVVCHSNVVAARVLALAPHANVVTVPLPPLIDVEGLGASSPGAVAAAREWAHARYGLAPGAPLAVMAGHLRSYKGVEDVLEAWKRRPRSAEGAERLLLVGECYVRGRARRRVLASVDADPSIVFVNRYVDDGELVRLVSIARVLVLAYRRASQSGMAPLAAALGVPCLVSEAGALAEQLPGARRVPSGDVAALAAALAAALGEALAAKEPRRSSIGAVQSAAPAAPDGSDFHAQWRAVVEGVGARLRQ